MPSNSLNLINNRATENNQGKSPGGAHKTPKLMKSQFAGNMKPDSQTLDPSRNSNALQEDYKTDDNPPSQTSKNRFGPNMQTLPPPDSKSNTPVNPQGFQGAPND